VKNRRIFALFFIAASVHFSGAMAQNVYRCGSNYSQVPCPDGTEIQVQDPRTPEQKQASDARIRHDQEVAQGMEKARLKEEAALAKQRAAQTKADAAAKKKEKRDAKSAKKPSKKAKSPAQKTSESSRVTSSRQAAKPQPKASAAKPKP